jgi:hypothetical protein
MFQLDGPYNNCAAKITAALEIFAGKLPVKFRYFYNINRYSQFDHNKTMMEIF